MKDSKRIEKFVDDLIDDYIDNPNTWEVDGYTVSKDGAF